MSNLIFWATALGRACKIAVGGPSDANAKALEMNVFNAGSLASNH